MEDGVEMSAKEESIKDAIASWLDVAWELNLKSKEHPSQDF